MKRERNGPAHLDDRLALPLVLAIVILAAVIGWAMS